MMVVMKGVIFSSVIAPTAGIILWLRLLNPVMLPLLAMLVMVRPPVEIRGICIIQLRYSEDDGI